MKKYLLFVYGNFQYPEFCQYAITTVSEVTHTELLRFKIENGSMFIHFGTEYDFKYLSETLMKQFKSKVTSFFLTEFNESTSIYMDVIDLESFLSLKPTEKERQLTQNTIHAFSHTLCM